MIAQFFRVSHAFGVSLLVASVVGLVPALAYGQHQADQPVQTPPETAPGADDTTDGNQSSPDSTDETDLAAGDNPTPDGGERDSAAKQAESHRNLGDDADAADRGPRLGAQFGVGAGGGVLGGLAGGIAGLTISSPIWLPLLFRSQGGIAGAFFAAFAMVVSASVFGLAGVIVGTSFGVHLMGNYMGGDGSFGWTTAGATIGSLVGLVSAAGLQMVSTAGTTRTRSGTGVANAVVSTVGPLLFLSSTAGGALIGYESSSSSNSGSARGLHPTLSAPAFQPASAGSDGGVLVGIGGRF